MSASRKKATQENSVNSAEIRNAALEVCALIAGAKTYPLRDADLVDLACVRAILAKAYKQAVLVSDAVSNQPTAKGGAS